MSKPKVIIVTGANRGIGRAICEKILSLKEPISLVACSRAGSDLGLKPGNTESKVFYPQLDISDKSMITSLANYFEMAVKQIDVLINNAGTNDTGGTGVPASEVLEVNYRGTLNMCQAFLPLMRENGRIVNLSSVGSSLDNYGPEVRSAFRNSNMTLKDLEDLVSRYERSLSSNSTQEAGFGTANGYSVSKASVNALTGILAREYNDVTINCCCPGWVATDMGSIVGTPSKTPEEGARIPFRLAFGDLQGISGRYFANRGVSDTGEGNVVEW